MSNEENIAVLRRRRATIQGSCTRIRTFAEAVTSLTPSILAQLEERRSKLNNFWSDYETVQTELESLDESEASHRAIFEDTFYALSAKMRELTVHEPVFRDGASSPSAVNTSSAPESIARVRLPKINLPTFREKYDEWYPFFDTFQALIHSNTTLSDIQKFQYLRASERRRESFN